MMEYHNDNRQIANIQLVYVGLVQACPNYKKPKNKPYTNLKISNLHSHDLEHIIMPKTITIMYG